MELVPKLMMFLGMLIAAGGATVAIAQVSHVLQIRRIFAGKPALLSGSGDGPILAQGVIQAVGEPIKSFDDGRPLVYRYLDVHESGAGRHQNHSHHRSATWAPFAIDDGTGAIEVIGEGATVLSPAHGSGPVTPQINAFIGDPKYKWEGSRRMFFELGLSPGDFVTVRGDLCAQDPAPDGKPRRAIARTGREPLSIVRGEPRLLATTEGRWLVKGIVAVPVGTALLVAGWLLAAVAAGLSR